VIALGVVVLVLVLVVGWRRARKVRSAVAPAAASLVVMPAEYRGRHRSPRGRLRGSGGSM
jgi:hypothetical protein